MDALKALLSGGRVIAFYPELARAVGGINEAIMLQQFMHWCKADPDGWFWHTQEQIEEETTIKKDAQQAIRKRLVAVGVIEEKREGLPARMYFRIKWAQIANLLSRCITSTSSGTPPQQEAVSDRNINRNNEMIRRDDINESPPRRVKFEYPPMFQEFWAAYPPGHGDKQAAFAEWKKLSPDDEMRAEILAGIEEWKHSKRWRDGYIKDAERFLKGQMWKNVEPPPPSYQVDQRNDYLRNW